MIRKDHAGTVTNIPFRLMDAGGPRHRWFLKRPRRTRIADHDLQPQLDDARPPLGGHAEPQRHRWASRGGWRPLDRHPWLRTGAQHQVDVHRKIRLLLVGAATGNLSMERWPATGRGAGAGASSTATSNDQTIAQRRSVADERQHLAPGPSPAAAGSLSGQRSSGSRV